MMTGFTPKTLKMLMDAVPVEMHVVGEIPDVLVTGVSYNHRTLQKGNIFVAQKGMHVDSHQFIPLAIERGAVAVFGMQELEGLSVPYVRVKDSREALAHLAAAFYGYPGRDMTVIGVTGTDGKTTTANLIYHILLAANLRAGIISTVNAVLGDEVVDTGFHVTTPEAPEVQRYLARMRTAGLTHVVLESTSHGLAQHRVTGCEFDIAVVTNVTHEHLDFHGTYENYLEAKSKLFRLLRETRPKERGNPRLGVLNLDDESYAYLKQVTAGRQVSYSLSPGADYWADSMEFAGDSTRFVVVGPAIRQPVHTCLVGPYNVSNCLAAFCATVEGLGIDPEVAARGIASMRGVPGRMERIHMGQPFLAVVDFAHTPNALKQVLLAARQMVRGRVIAVFGSAGLRDREKRKMMAEVSAELADFTILTAEDPRTESLEDILAEMAAGATGRGGVEGVHFIRVPDRGEALRRAVQMARPEDCVIACGKGHEQSMCFGETEYPWDDRVAMRAALAELLGVEGPSMPELPTSSSV